MSRPYNFSAGPAVLPESVLRQAREEMLDWHGSGMSVMEMSHRGPQFTDIAQRAEAALRSLMEIPDDYFVLFLQGGASGQFSAVPLNLLGGTGQADYVLTGAWSRKAAQEASKYGDISIAASSEADGFTSVPETSRWHGNEHADYLHYTPNETIGGVEFDRVPDTGGVPLIADMSSSILSQPIDVTRFGVIYAGAQKNIGPAGLTVVIVRRELTGRAMAVTPAVLDYAAQAAAGSMGNTPPTYSWYLAGLVFDWLHDQGGLGAIAEINLRKSQKLYAAIDSSDFYANPVSGNSRSRMNIPFTLARPELDDLFLQQAGECGLLNLKGHRSVGGMRASIYNAMPEAGVDALLAFMTEFGQRHG